MSPDPSSLALANPSNPQSPNLYGYVTNNPLSHIDLSGLAIQYSCSTGNSVTGPSGIGSDGSIVQNVTVNSGTCCPYAVAPSKWRSISSSVLPLVSGRKNVTVMK